MTSFSESISDLKNIRGVLLRLERHGIGLADYAQGLRRVSAVLGVALQEMERVEKEQTAIANDLGEHLLNHESLIKRVDALEAALVILEAEVEEK